MITSTVGRSLDPFETFSIEIEDKENNSWKDTLFTNQSSGQSPSPQGPCQKQPATAKS